MSEKVLPPHIVDEWHPDKNLPLTPDKVSPGSSKKVWWKCSHSHEWEAAIGNRVSKNQACPFCSGKRVIEGINDLLSQHPEVAAEWHPKKNSIAPNEIFRTSQKKVWWLGKCGHEWEAKIANRAANNAGCPVCTGRKVSKGVNDILTTHPDIADEWHPTKNSSTPQDFSKGSHEKVWWLGKSCGHEWEMAINSRTSHFQSCPFCSGNRLLLGINDLESQRPDVSIEWHPTYNDGLFPKDVFVSSSKTAWWLGHCNHSWKMRISDRTTNNQGCPICRGLQILIGFNDLASQRSDIASEWHPDKNGHLTAEMVTPGSSQKVWWLGECGHEWEMGIYSRTGPLKQGCPTCANRTLLVGFNDFSSINPLLSSEWHPMKNGDLTAEHVFPVSARKVWWLGKCGHEWEAQISNRVFSASDCPICAGQKVLVGFNDLASQNPVIAAQWHPTKNGALTPIHFTTGSDKRVWWVCDKGHEWEAPIHGRARNNLGCAQCYAKTFVSKGEQDIADFIVSLGLNIVQSDRKTLKRKELDIVVPEKKVAIEFNGVFWHSEPAGKDKDYHRNKWIAAKEAGIQLIQVWEDEWNRNPEQIKRMIAHKLGFSTGRRVFARKTLVQEMSKVAAEKFLNEHHVQGYAAGSYYLGLFEKRDLFSPVALLVLRKENANDLNIIRYATSENVVGGFTKLLKYTEKTYEPNAFITFSDHCVSDGGLYENNGFVADKELAPDYRYVVNGERKHKFGYRLKRFQDDPALQWFDGLTERELADLNGIARIWDAGKTRWVKRCNES